MQNREEICGCDCDSSFKKHKSKKTIQNEIETDNEKHIRLRNEIIALNRIVDQLNNSINIRMQERDALRRSIDNHLKMIAQDGKTNEQKS